MKLTIGPGAPLRGRVRVPGDKSISHRALVLGALAEGETTITGLLDAQDVRSTWRCLEALGTAIRQEGEITRVEGRGGRLEAPRQALDCGNSGTTMRLLTGVIAGQPISARLDGDRSLRRRPMARVIRPVEEMGARVESTGGCAPMTIHGHRELRGIQWRMPMASAQVKSALLLAGWQASGTTHVLEPAPSRDHTERMLDAMGIATTTDASGVAIRGGGGLQGTALVVPGDLSSAAFLVVAATLVEGSDLVLQGVGLNPTRTGLLDVLRRMGAQIELVSDHSIAGERRADLRVQAAALRGTTIGGAEIPRLIDELPILALAAACAEGRTTVSDAEELRVKESDRIATTIELVRALGGRIEERPDGWVLDGGAPLHGATISAKGDHRVALTAAVAGLVCPGGVIVEGSEAMEVSFPTLPSHTDSLREQR